MKVVVTGGCGFIGSNFIRYYIKKHPNDRILNIDKLTYAGNLENLKGLARKKNYSFVKADIASAKVMENIFNKFKPDAVLNFAAETHVDRSITAPAPFIKTNFLGVGVLLNCAIEFGIKKFIQISTDEVYGSIARGSFKEKNPLKPSSPYAASKAAADGLAIAYYKTYALPVVITRSSNNYGPYQFPEKFIPLIIMNALGKKKIPVYGDGRNVRNWLYVKDNCEAIDTVFRKGAKGEIYNIGGDHEMTNISLLKKILKYLGRDESLIAYVKDRPGHDRRYSLSSNKIMKQLNWQPKTSFAAGIKKTTKWYQENKIWLKNTQTGKYRNLYRKYYSKLGLKEF